MADTPYQGFIGATYGGDARHLSAEQYINLYPEPTGAPGTTPKRPLALLPAHQRWTPIFGQVVQVESRSDRRNLECHARDGAPRLS